MKKTLAILLSVCMILALLAGCGASKETPAATTETPAATTESTSGLPYEGHTLYVANWQGYNSDEDYCEKVFEDRTGAKVEHVYFNSYDELMTTLMTGGNKTIDAVVLSNNYTQWFYEEGLIAPLDTAKLTNYAGVAEVYKDLSPYALAADGNLYGVPWCNGTTSLAYNPEYVDWDLEHWTDLLDPKLKGHVMTLNSDGDNWVLGCLLAGEDSDDLASADIEAVRTALNELKGQLLGFWGSNDEQTIPWLAGDFWAGCIWSGPYSQLLHNESTSIKLVHPSEGTIGFIDYWAVVNGTDESDLAHEWLNWIISEEQQSAMATGVSDEYPGEYYTYTPVNQAAIDNLTPEQKIDLQLDPMPTKIKLLPYVGDPDVKDQWVDLYQEFVS